jgi:alkanesulfonate monooxygenase SsuD/methylene tetrahydromethanopterin reductase-like flavin-dependent oxidoreductase (luciferase family)
VVFEGMLNLSFDKPLRHMKEYLSILMPLIHDQKVSFAGETLTTHAELTIGKPQSCDVVIAALGPQMLRLAAAMTQGTLTWCTGPETLRTLTVPTITEAAEKLGKPQPRVIAALPVCVTKDVDSARARAAQVFAVYGQLPSYRAMLDHEGAAVLELVQQAIYLELVFHHTVQFRHHDATLQGGLLGKQLVVNQLIVTARVVGANKGDIAAVHAQNAQPPQGGWRYQPDHFILAMSRKRYSSDRR